MLIRRFLGHWIAVAVFAAGIMMAIPAIPAMAQNQPNMQAALRNLQRGRNRLNAAKANKGGHRKRAINLVNRAISEAQAGMAYARRNRNNGGKNGKGSYPAGHGRRASNPPRH